MTHLPFYIARRYLFAKKSHRVVNIISMISLFGFCIGTAALVIVLSVFNGFEGLITGMYNQFDPDIRISPTKGKTIIIEGEIEEYLAQHPSIASYSPVLEEKALLIYNGKQSTATIKGVSNSYRHVTGIDSLMLQGEFILKTGDTYGAVLGMGLAYKLGAGLKFINSLVVKAPKRIGSISLSNPENSFTSDYFKPTGFFAIYQPEIDMHYVLVDLSKAQDLFQYDNEISAVELHLNAKASIDAVKRDLKAQLGEHFLVQDRFEQKANLYKMLAMEKWMSSIIVIFILIIAVFNIVGTLSMLIIEKGKDIKTLQSIGANNSLIRKIFYTEGSMVAFLGALIGMVLGIVTCLLQQHFGIIRLGSSGQYIVDAYPVELLPIDLAFVFITVIII
ncbi:MAG: ABC transporter permease, partial [Bacteroidales bacterium]|nr:ABC transporter permease [Bacteroidales bacterium]